MKFGLSWLKDHLDTDASAEALADKLTNIGLEVEALSNPAEALAPFKISRPAMRTVMLSMTSMTAAHIAHDAACAIQSCGSVCTLLCGRRSMWSVKMSGRE